MYTLGKKLKFTLYGKSHGPCVGGILEGVPKNVPVDLNKMAEELALRKPSKGIGTDRVETDLPEIVGGIQNGKTDGNDIILKIMNGNVDDSKYLPFMETPRPGHADLPALLDLPKFDICGGGQFSGRLTAPIVAAGSIAKEILALKGIRVGAFCRSIGTITDENERTLEDAVKSRGYSTRACTKELDEKMSECIMAARKDADSVGGIVECIVTGLPIGFGGIWFESLDAELAGAMFGIPACKGIEFGKGFELTKMRGSESNDAYRFDENGRIITVTNNMGGIVGGMSDGAPLVFRTAFKPTPSIGKTQQTVNIKTGKNADLKIEGRHDPCIAPRAVAVVEAVAALVIADQMERGL